jgi:hypothetical protein
MCDGNDLNLGASFSKNDQVGKTSQWEVARAVDVIRPTVRLLANFVDGSIDFFLKALGSARTAVQIP